ncbi:MAG: hypothetical protein IPJ71_01820 [Bdellovibrionales bacterium]|nr:hypothetical protein [Bdellovibrionales bacterium]
MPQQPEENLTERCAQESRKIYPNSRDLPFVQLSQDALRETQIEILNSFNRFCIGFHLNPSGIPDESNPCVLVSERLKELGLWNSPETAELSTASMHSILTGKTDEKNPRSELIQSPRFGVVWDQCPKEIRSTAYWKWFLDILNFELSRKSCELSKMKIEVDCAIETERIQKNSGQSKISSIGLKIHEFGNQAMDHKERGFLLERVLSFPKFLDFSDLEDNGNGFFVPDYGSIQLRLRKFFSKHDICEGSFLRRTQPDERGQSTVEQSGEIASRKEFITLNSNWPPEEMATNFLTNSFPYNLSTYVQRNTDAKSILIASNCQILDLYSGIKEDLEWALSFFKLSFSDNTNLVVLPLSLDGIDDLNKDGNLSNKMYRLKYLTVEKSSPFGLGLKTKVSESILKTEKLDNLDPQKEGGVLWHWFNETDGSHKNIEHISKIELNQAIELLTHRKNISFSDNKACFLQRLLKF